MSNPKICGANALLRQYNVQEKQNELKKHGVTNAQAKAKGWLSERLFQTIEPDSYPGQGESHLSHFSHLIAGQQRVIHPHPTNDAWATYLGLPQPGGYLEMSEDVPPPDLHPCSSANEEFYKFSNRAHADERFVPFALRQIEKITERASTTGESVWTKQVKAGRFQVGGYEFSVPRSIEGPDTSLHHFSIISGHDERGEYLAYYDVWDLDPKLPLTDVRIPFETVAGKPFVFFHKVHFDRTRAERIVKLEDELMQHAQVPAWWAIEDEVTKNPKRFPGALVAELASLDPRYRSPGEAPAASKVPSP
jgi:hypothetical protein